MVRTHFAKVIFRCGIGHQQPGTLELDRVRTHGVEGFEHTVAMSVLAASVQRLGWVLRRQLREKEKRRYRHAA